VYLEANDPTPDILVSQNQTGTTYNPSGLEYYTTYYWRIHAKDFMFGIASPVWHFTTEGAMPNLECYGSLSWIQIPAGSTQTDTFTLENIGDPTSLLDWGIESYPDWGTWTFTPSSGNDLTPEAGLVTVQVTVTAPDQQNEQFSGEIKVVNRENTSDFDIVTVSLSTPTTKASPVPSATLGILRIKQLMSMF
jgi:hypothetical protein